jgi:pyroglutamyl-peptidase
MPGIVLLAGFAPFGGERVNPSWEVAKRLDGAVIEGAVVRAVRLQVETRAAIQKVTRLIAELRPDVVLGLGQAGGRHAISIERVAVNLFSRDEAGGKPIRPVIDGAPAAYFTRLAVKSILDVLQQAEIPAVQSFTAGIFVCNAVMYAILHALRHNPAVFAGFIHLPYATGQAVHHKGMPSMSLDLMESAVTKALSMKSRWKIRRRRLP